MAGLQVGRGIVAAFTILAASCHDFGASGDTSDGKAAPLDAGGPDAGPLGAPVDLATNQDGPRALVVDNAAVYWINDAVEAKKQPGAIMKVDKGGGAAILLGELVEEEGQLAHPIALSQDATRLFVTSNDTSSGANYQVLYRVEKNGGKPQALRIGANGGMFGIFVQGTEALFIEQQTDVPAGKLATIGTDPWTANVRDIDKELAGATYLAADLESAYVATPNRILKVSRSSGPHQVFASTGETARAIVIDAAQGVVFWAERTAIRALPANSPGTTPRDIATGQSDVSAITTFGGDVFFCTVGDNAVWRVPQSGGTPIPIAHDEAEPTSIGVDAAGVYWTNHRDGRVRAARR
jgi:hypothetical protein